MTQVALVCGIVGSKRTHLPVVASKLPDGSSPRGGKRERRGKRFARFLQNPKVTPEAFFVPYARALVDSLPPDPLVLVMDGRQVGRGCMALMLSVLYECKHPYSDGKQALPPCWQVVKAKKGHFLQEKHQELLAQVRALILSGRTVIFVGDGEFDNGEFDGGDLLQDITTADWHFVCRIAKNVLLQEADWPGETFSLAALGLQPGDCVELSDVLFTA